MKLSAVAAGALLTVSNVAIAADAAAPAASATPDAATPAEKPAASAEPAHKVKSADASGPKSPEARCAAKIGHATGDNKWEFKGDKAEKAYVACVAKAD